MKKHHMIMNKSPLTIEYHSKTHSTVNMDQRASIDGCLNYEGVPTDGWSQIYVGGIDIRFQNVYASQNSIKHENEDLIAVDEETRSTSCCRLSHTWVTWQKYSSHSVCPWGQVSIQGCHLVLDSFV